MPAPAARFAASWLDAPANAIRLRSADNAGIAAVAGIKDHGAVEQAGEPTSRYHRLIASDPPTGASRPRLPPGIRGLVVFFQPIVRHRRTPHHIKEVTGEMSTGIATDTPVLDGSLEGLLGPALGLGALGALDGSTGLDPLAKECPDDVPCRVEDAELWFAETPADSSRPRPSARTARPACLPGGRPERREPWGVWGGEIFERGAIIARKRPRGRPRKDERTGVAA